MFEEYVSETNAKYFYYNQTTDNIETYNLLDTDNLDVFEYKIGDLIETPRISHATDILIKWIQQSTSIFVVGPSASGKRFKVSR